MIEIVEKYLLIFFAYAMAGWLMETTRGFVKTKKWVNRGFLIGPYCPVYGVGLCLLTVWLSDYVDDIPIMFFMSVLICGTLEYCTSYIMEKIFKARWWDYSNRRFNINGRICLENLIPFGIAGVILVKYANPFILKLLNFTCVPYILIVISIIFIIDFVFSFIGILGFRKETKQAEIEVKDNTDEISSQMKELLTQKYEEFKEDAGKRAMTIQIATAKTINNLREGASSKLKGVGERIDLRSKKFVRNVEFTGLKLRRYLVNSTEKIKTNFTKPKEEYLNKLVKEKVKKKPWPTRRLLSAFPNMKIKVKKENNEE